MTAATTQCLCVWGACAGNVSIRSDFSKGEGRNSTALLSSGGAATEDLPRTNWTAILYTGVRCVLLLLKNLYSSRDVPSAG
jgi:hypothetical protein